MVEDIAAANAQLARAMVEAPLLILALVPQKAAVAHRLLSDGAEVDATVLAVISQPSAYDGRTGWQRLQLAPDARRLVNKLMLSVPELSSLDIFLCPEHAARASDLLAAAVALAPAHSHDLLKPDASEAFLAAMTYEQAKLAPIDGSSVPHVVVIAPQSNSVPHVVIAPQI